MEKGLCENICRSTLDNKSYRIVSVLAVIGVVGVMAVNGLSTTSDWMKLIWKLLISLAIIFIGFAGYKMISSNIHNKPEEDDKNGNKKVKSKKELDKILDKMDRKGTKIIGANIKSKKKASKPIKSKKELDKVLDKMDRKAKSKSKRK